MSENIFLSIYMFFIMIFILVIQIITPKVTRKEIAFGVRIPSEEAKSKEVVGIYKNYVRNNFIICLPSIFIITLINYYIAQVSFIVISIFIFMGISFTVYLISNNKIKKLKNEKKWLQSGKGIVMVDTSLSKQKNQVLVSPWWFIIPVALIILNIAIGYHAYPLLANKVATHWDFSGNPNGWQNKSIFLIWEMPIAEMFMVAVFFVSYKVIGWSKQQISSSNPEASIKRNLIFRRKWSIYMVVSTIIMTLLLTLGTLQIMQVLIVKGTTMMIVVFGTIALFLIATIVISIKLGQGGSNIKLDEEDDTDLDKNQRNDDKYWKLGNTIYYNPDDPAIMVEKRFGVGWTVNAGRPLGMAIYIVIIILTAVVLIISFWLK